jgi:hypothetical protein
VLAAPTVAFVKESEDSGVLLTAIPTGPGVAVTGTSCVNA